MKKKYKCEDCFRDDFKSENGLQQHIRKAHPYFLAHSQMCDNEENNY